MPTMPSRCKFMDLQTIRPLSCSLVREPAIAYLDERHPKCANILRAIKPTVSTEHPLGSTEERGACRVEFGDAVSRVLDKTSKEENQGKVMVIDSDLEGSTGLSAIHKSHPEYVHNSPDTSVVRS